MILFFLKVDEWIVRKDPALVFVETLINDGDDVLTSRSAVDVQRAFEGIIRRIRVACPRASIVLIGACLSLFVLLIIIIKWGR